MKRSRFSEEQIIGILKEHQAGLSAAELCRKHGISDATFYTRRKKYGGMEVSAPRRQFFGTGRGRIGWLHRRCATQRSICSVKHPPRQEFGGHAAITNLWSQPSIAQRNLADQPFETLADGGFGFLQMRIEAGEIGQFAGTGEKLKQTFRRVFGAEGAVDAQAQDLGQGLIEVERRQKDVGFAPGQNLGLGGSIQNDIGFG